MTDVLTHEPGENCKRNWILGQFGVHSPIGDTLPAQRASRSSSQGHRPWSVRTHGPQAPTGRPFRTRARLEWSGHWPLGNSTPHRSDSLLSLFLIYNRISLVRELDNTIVDLALWQDAGIIQGFRLVGLRVTPNGIEGVRVRFLSIAAVFSRDCIVLVKKKRLEIDN